MIFVLFADLVLQLGGGMPFRAPERPLTAFSGGGMVLDTFFWGRRPQWPRPKGGLAEPRRGGTEAPKGRNKANARGSECAGAGSTAMPRSLARGGRSRVPGGAPQDRVATIAGARRDRNPRPPRARRAARRRDGGAHNSERSPKQCAPPARRRADNGPEQPHHSPNSWHCRTNARANNPSGAAGDDERPQGVEETPAAERHLFATLVRADARAPRRC